MIIHNARILTPAETIANGWVHVHAGTIAPGRADDFVVLDERLQVCRVMHRGNWIAEDLAPATA